MTETDDIQTRRVNLAGRETFFALMRKPWVQLLLLGTAGAQVVTVQAGGIEPHKLVIDVDRDILRLAPAMARPDSASLAEFEDEVVIEKSKQLAAEYRTKGFDVTVRLATQIGEAAAEFDIEPEIAFGLVKAESSFENQATSRVGAVGLTQLMPGTARWMEPGVTRSELRDPETNLRVGFKYLRYLLDKYEGDATLALLAYNRGPGTVDKALKRGRNPDNGYADFVFGKENHGHRLFTRK